MTGLLMVALAAVPKVASPDWAVVNLKHELVLFYADSLAHALRQEGLEVVTSQDIATLLGQERQRQLLACDEGSTCLAELANALGCDATLTVNLVRFDDGGFRGLAKVINSRDGSIVSSAKLEARNERALLEALEAAAPSLAGPLVHRGAAAAGEASGPKKWWLLPASLTVASVITGAVLFSLSASDAHTLSTTQLDYGAASTLASRGSLMQGVAWVFMGVGAAAAIGTVLALVLGAPPSSPTVAVVPMPGGLSVMGAF